MTKIVEHDGHVAESTQQPMPFDIIQEIYDQVILLQKREFGRTWPRDKDEFIEKYFRYIIVEAVEALQCSNFKEHKAKRPIDIEGLRKEISDLLIYVFALSGIVFDSLEDFLKTVKEKQEYNKIREDWNVK